MRDVRGSHDGRATGKTSMGRGTASSAGEKRELVKPWGGDDNGRRNESYYVISIMGLYRQQPVTSLQAKFAHGNAIELAHLTGTYMIM